MKTSNKKNNNEESDLSTPESSDNEEYENSDIIEDDDEDENETIDDENEEDEDNTQNNLLENELQKDNDDEDECFYNIEHEEVVNNLQNNEVLKEDRITMSSLTKYERVRVLGTRAKQIELGAKILVKDIDLKNKTPIEIAKIELNHGVIPFKIRRTLPNGKVEEWKISELVN
jgi:DNA-directed RNA polymerase I, II, and III subunit RPABC2